MAKMDEALNTPELLELILSQLPMRTLLLAQQVCRTFNATIASSPTLQQALFFRSLPTTTTPTPAPSSTKLLHYPDDEPVTETWEPNPLLASAFWPWFERNTPKSRLSPPFWGPEAVKDLVLPDAATSSTFLRPEASWRRMLLTQPPVAELQVMLATQFRGGNSLDDASLCPGNGVRMGLLYDVTCQELLASQSRALRTFRVQWHGADKKIVLSFRCIRKCIAAKGQPYLVVKDRLSGTWEKTAFEWRRSSSFSNNVLLAGDYEAENFHWGE